MRRPILRWAPTTESCAFVALSADGNISGAAGKAGRILCLYRPCTPAGTQAHFRPPPSLVPQRRRFPDCATRHS